MKGPKDKLVILGYAAWQPGQLENEIARNDWITGPASYDVLFDTPIQERIKVAAEKIGIDINRVVSQAGHA